MKINNKGYASTIIMFSILTLFLISMLMLVKTMSNSSTLNKKITEKVVDNINYDASGTVQDQIAELNTTITSMQNQIDNIKGEVINEIYPVGSIYMSTEDDTIEKVQTKFGGTWEKYAQGRTLIGEGTSIDSNGLVQTFKANDSGGSMSKSGNYTPSGSISNYNGKSGDTALSIEQTPAGLARITYNSSNNWSLGVWASYGNGYTVTMKDQAGYGSYGSGHNHTINHSHTFTGTKSSISVAGLDPYVVTYMYRKISN